MTGRSNVWSILREKYLTTIQAKRLKLVIPSQSVKDNLILREPRYNDVDFVLIPNGTFPMQPAERVSTFAQVNGGKLRILAIGRLTPDKGLGILKEIADELTSFAELFLVGCNQGGNL
jgi:hypothetical protein